MFHALISVAVSGSAAWRNQATDETLSALTCLPQEQSNSLARSLFSAILPGRRVALEIQDWPTHRLHTRILEILLRERLDYQVEVRYYALLDQSSGAAYQRVGDGFVDVNAEVHPALVRPLRASLVEANRIRSSGAIGYDAREGWFVNRDALTGSAPLTRMYQNATGWRLESDAIDPVDFIRRFSSAAVGRLKRAEDVAPPDFDLCLLPGNPSPGGTYDCANGTWTADHLRCSPKGTPRGSRPPCAALIAQRADFAPGQNERIIVSAGLDLQITYSMDTRNVFNTEQPTLFYSNAPSLFVNANPTNATFVRINFLDHLRCDDGRFHPKATSTPYPNPSLHCDFAQQRPETIVAQAFLNRGYNSEQASTLLLRYSQSDESVNTLLVLYQTLIAQMGADPYALARHVGTDRTKYDGNVEFAVACEWLKANKAVWARWISPIEDDIMISWLVVTIVTLLSVVYTSNAIYRFYFGVDVVRGTLRYALGTTQKAAVLVTQATVRNLLAVADLHPGETPTGGALATAVRLSQWVATCRRGSGGAPTISFAAAEYACAETDESVLIALKRFGGDTSRPATATVITRDGTAVFGRHYAQLVQGGDGPVPQKKMPVPYSVLTPHAGDVTRHPARIEHVRFAAGEATALVRVAMCALDQVTSSTFFHVHLESAALADGTPLARSPISDAVVHIRDVSYFPNSYTLKHPRPDLRKTYTSYAQAAAAAVDDLQEATTVKTLTSKKKKKKKKGSSQLGFREKAELLLDRLQLARHFAWELTKFEAHWTFWWHVQHVFLAGTSFSNQLLFALFIDHGLGSDGHPGWCLTLGVAKLCTWVLTYRVFYFIPPTYSAMIDLKNNLTRKFLSLPEALLNQNPQLEAAFCHAISTSSERAWLRIFNDFHAAFFNVYSLLGSFAYILYAARSWPTILPWLSVALLGIAVGHLIVFWRRVWRVLEFGRDFAEGQKAAAEYTYHIVRDWPLIRSNRLEDATNERSSALRFAYNNHDFWMWLHTVRTDRVMSLIVEVVIVAGWLWGYELTKYIQPGQLISLLGALSSFNSSWTAFFALVRNCARYSFDVEEVAELMNLGIDPPGAQSREQPTVGGGSRDVGEAWHRLDALSAAINAGSATDDGRKQMLAFYVSAPSYGADVARGEPCFDNLRIEGLPKCPMQGSFLPSGLTGLRVGASVQGSGTVFEAQAAATFLHLLAGTLLPTSGQIFTVPMLTVRIVDRPVAAIGSLLGNLLFGAHGRGEPLERARLLRNEEGLWRLCRRVGMSDVLLGTRFEPGWSSVSVSGRLVPPPVGDLYKLSLVSALLHQPDVLLVAGAWSVADSAHLIRTLRSFLDGSIDALLSASGSDSLEALEALDDKAEATALHGAAESTQRASSRLQMRTVMWSADDHVLAACLRGEDRVLTLESPQLTRLTNATEAFAGTTAEAAGMALLGSGDGTTVRDRVQVGGSTEAASLALDRARSSQLQQPRPAWLAADDDHPVVLQGNDQIAPPLPVATRGGGERRGGGAGTALVNQVE